MSNYFINLSVIVTSRDRDEYAKWVDLLSDYFNIFLGIEAIKGGWRLTWQVINLPDNQLTLLLLQGLHIRYDSRTEPE